ESTCYYAKAHHRHLDTLVDVLTDLYLHPRFASADIEKERQVIKEELRTYHDQPDHYVHELLTEALWPEHPLGRSLTGTAKSLDATDRDALVRYKQTKYVAGNTVVAVAGRCQHDDVVDRLQKALTISSNGRSPRFLPARDRQRSTRLRFLQKPVEQAHLAIGIRGYSRHHPKRFAQKLLSVILGENMSSRLFQVIREQHGLAYSIQSATSYFSDTGAFVISAGLDAKRLGRALGLVMRELKEISRKAPSATELRRAKDYGIGQMRLGLESTSNQMMWIGDHLQSYGTIHTPEEIERNIEAVGPEEIHEVAQGLFRESRLNAAVITPRKDEQKVDDLLHF
ncbi:MAG: M16 family metallopeptidase, partial [Gammaproteobacteria bacterium]